MNQATGPETMDKSMEGADFVAPRRGGNEITTSEERLASLNKEKIRLNQVIEETKGKLSSLESFSNDERKRDEIRHRLDYPSINGLFGQINNAIALCREEGVLRKADQLVTEISSKVNTLLQNPGPAHVIVVGLDHAVAEPVGKMLGLNDKDYAENLKKLDTVNCRNILATQEKTRGQGSLMTSEALFGLTNK